MYFIQELKDLLRFVKEEDLSSSFNNFETKKDTDISYFLKKLAIDYEKRDIARTFLICDEEYKGKIFGYFTIGLNVLKLENDFEIEDAYKGVHLYEKGYHPIYKLFMIGKNDNCPVKFSIKEKVFTNEVLNRFVELKDKIGTNIVYLDCTKELTDYYKDLGFCIFNYDKENSLYNMIYKLC